MCGLYGWSLRRSRKRGKARILLGMLSTLNGERGKHSWGFFGSATPSPVKGLGAAACMPNRAFETAASCSWLIGHTRYATTGKISVPNAHPFHIGSVVGAHNGTLDNHRELCAIYDRSFEVDSMHIFAHLDEGLPLDDIIAYGAVSFCLHPAKEQRVYLGRFNGGELSIASIDGFGLVWSSEREHLSLALRACGLEGRFLPLKEGRCYAACKGELFTTDFDLSFTDPWQPQEILGDEDLEFDSLLPPSSVY